MIPKHPAQIRKRLRWRQNLSGSLSTHGRAKSEVAFVKVDTKDEQVHNHIRISHYIHRRRRHGFEVVLSPSPRHFHKLQLFVHHSYTRAAKTGAKHQASTSKMNIHRPSASFLGISRLWTISVQIRWPFHFLHLRESLGSSSDSFESSLFKYTVIKLYPVIGKLLAPTKDYLSPSLPPSLHLSFAPSKDPTGKYFSEVLSALTVWCDTDLQTCLPARCAFHFREPSDMTYGHCIRNKTIKFQRSLWKARSQVWQTPL